jgi:hypothetical protein
MVPALKCLRQLDSFLSFCKVATGREFHEGLLKAGHLEGTTGCDSNPLYISMT